MTAIHVMWLASIAGAVLFFAGGVATGVLRRGATPAAHEVPAPAAAVVAAPDPALAPALEELARLRGLEQARTEERTQERTQLTEELARLRQALARADRARATELAAHEAAIAQLRAEVTRWQADAAQLEEAAAQRARAHTGELDRLRQELVVAGSELAQARARLAEAEQQVAERTQAVRELSTLAEQLKGRIGDAEALRVDYVRLRTRVTESEFLRGEVARLEKEIRAVKVTALGAPRRPPAHAQPRPPTPPRHSIGESLASVLDRFADAGTRSLAIADPQGFPLASSGEEGLALAAFAALLLEAANRAQQFLPLAMPSVLELIDDHGTRVSVWTFRVDNEPLLLANLALTPVDRTRVDATLADLTAILTPSTAATGT